LTRTLIGKKALMAVTGLALFGFVIVHMLGNLKVFQGPEHLNAYAEGLRTLGAPFFGHGQLLWILRLALIAAVLVHIWAAYETTRASWAGRPERYRHGVAALESTYAARTMRWGGVLILAYVVYHLLDLTFGPANPSFVPGDVYHNLVASFQRVPVAGFYMLANIAVGLHVYHGLWSAFQTLGVNRTNTDRWRRNVAAAIAAALTAGYLIVPVAVLAGWVR
jgi:succinate dehydrogenase / fumarate reductase cytochrome b subunit